MTDEHRCPSCGRTLETGGVGCPGCLLGLALETSSGGDESDGTENEARHLLGEGDTAGPYRVVRELGEGGMGKVYLAEQSKPIQRRVALKVVKHGMDTAQVVRRFETERQALALMDHEAIARVFDAGRTESGRPYFAMEFIEGEPITVFCERKRLDTAERLELFTRVCDGIQHAHRRGIIHRDVKPSNIMVVETEDGPRPKIIDFGIAKATEHSLTERSALTAMGVLLGTPEYMSPEQADLAPFDVDTRTDVFSLGAVLYELLAGARPFDLGSLERTTFDEIRRQIREVRPAPPGKHRRLSRDLDLIVMKALEKERDLRYESPADLADDIRRHLANEPVLARPSSAAYQLRKLAARNPAVTALLALVLLVGIVGAAVNVKQTRETRAERDRATQEAETARSVSAFLEELFAAADPRVSRGADVSVRDVLDMGAKRVETELADQPETQTRLLVLLGGIYTSLGELDLALELLERSAEVGRGVLDEQPLLDVERLRSLGWIHRHAGRLDEAMASAQSARDLALASLDPAEPLVADSLMLVGVVERDRGELEPSRDSLQRALDFAAEHLGEESASVGWTLFHLGWLEHLLGQHEAAAEHYERACPALETALKPNHPGLAECFNDHATILQALQRFEEAAEELGRAIEILERVLPPGHPRLATAITNMGNQAYFAGDYAAAESHYLRALSIREEALGPDHPDYGGSLCNLAIAYRNMRKFDESERTYLRGLAIIEAALGPDHPQLISNRFGLASIYDLQGRFGESLAIYEKAIASRERTHGADHPWTAGALRSAALVRARLGRHATAIAAMERAASISDKHFPAEQPGHRRMRVDLALVYQRAGRLERAREVARDVLDAGEQAGVRDAATAYAHYVLARIAVVDGKRDEALEHLDRAIERRAEARPENDPTLLYYRAAAAAQRGEVGRMLEALRECLDGGYAVYDVDTAVDLEPLRDDPDLQELLRERLPSGGKR